MISFPFAPNFQVIFHPPKRFFIIIAKSILQGKKKEPSFRLTLLNII